MTGIDPFGEFNFDKAFDNSCACGGECDCNSDKVTPQQFADQLMESTMAALRSLTEVTTGLKPTEGAVEAAKTILNFAVSMTAFGVGEIEEEFE